MPRTARSSTAGRARRAAGLRARADPKAGREPARPGREGRAGRRVPVRELIQTRDASQHGRWREQLPDLGLVFLMSAVPLVALRPLQNAPFVDDWVYAWSIEHLLRTGDLRFLDSAVGPKHAQGLWCGAPRAPLSF